MKNQTSATSLKSRHWLAIAALATFGIAPLAIAQTSWAQACDESQALGCASPNEQDAFSGGGGQMNVMDLMHKAQLGTLTNMEDFTVEQRENLNSAADAFRAQQLQQMNQGQTQAAPIEPAIAPAQQN